MNNTHQNWFVGLPVQDTGWFSGLVGEAPRALRVFHPDDLHLTIAFLGQCDFRYVDGVRRVIDTISFTPFSLSFDTLTTFPPHRRPTVVSFTLGDGYDEACDIIRRWREPLLVAGHARPDTREPLPHITIGRIRRGADDREIDDISVWAAGRAIPPVPVTIDRVALYTWADDRRERQFKVVYERRMD